MIIWFRITVSDHLGESDHNSMKFGIKYQTREFVSERVVPCFRDVNFDNVRHDILSIKFNNDFLTTYTIEQWDRLKDILDKFV